MTKIFFSIFPVKSIIWMWVIALIISGADFLSVVIFTKYIHFEISNESNFFKFLDETFIINFVIIAILSTTALRLILSWILQQRIQSMRVFASGSIISKYIHLPYSDLMKISTSDLTKQIISESDQLVGTLINPVINLIPQFFMIIALLIFLVIESSYFGATIFAVVSILYSVLYRFNHPKVKESGASRANYNRKRFDIVLELFRNLETLKYFGLHLEFKEKLIDYSAKMGKHIAKFSYYSMYPRYVIEGSIFLSIVGYISYVNSLNPDAGEHIFESLTTFLVISLRLMPLGSQLVKNLSSLNFSGIILHQFGEQTAHKNNTDTVTNFPELLFQFDKIEVTFPELYVDDKLIITNSILTLEYNKITFVSGPSGSGKTSILRNILGLDSETPIISLIDGKKEYENFKLNKTNCFLISQHNVIFSGTIKDNILRYYPDISKTGLVAAEILISEIMGSKKRRFNLDSEVGEYGVYLSGGERQRLILLIALLNDRPILILDEPTSALDDENAMKIFDKLKKSKKTILCITHDTKLVDTYADVKYDLRDQKLIRVS